MRGTDLHPLWAQLGITWWGVLGVVVATTLLYGLYTTVLQLWGARLLTGGSTLSLALVAVLAGLSARAMLGAYPTLLGAVVAIATLLCLERALGRVRAGLHGRLRWATTAPTLVLLDGRVRLDALRRRGLTERDLHARLRAAGVRRRDDVRWAILEARGGLTVVRRGEDVDAALFEDVEGLEEASARR